VGRSQENEQGQFCYRMGELTRSFIIACKHICYVISDYILHPPDYLLGQLYLGVLCVTEPP